MHRSFEIADQAETSRKRKIERGQFLLNPENGKSQL